MVMAALTLRLIWTNDLLQAACHHRPAPLDIYIPLFLKDFVDKRPVCQRIFRLPEALMALPLPATRQSIGSMLGPLIQAGRWRSVFFIPEVK
jgi:hypothetical protein